MNKTGLVVLLLTLMLHGGALLGLVWMLERAGVIRQLATRELAWRGALIAGVLTACVQLLVLPVPLTGTVSEYLPNARSSVLDVAAKAPNMALATPAASIVHANRSAPSVSGEFGTVLVTDSPPGESAVVTSQIQAPVVPPMRVPDWLLAINWSQLALVAWLATTLILLLRVLQSAIAVRALLRRAQPVCDPVAQSDWDALCARMHMPAARLAAVDGLASPVAIGASTVLIPGWVLGLSAAQRRAAFAHELEHLRRRDPYWRILLALWRSLFCAIPLIGTALRRLDAVAELHCDAVSARVTGDGRALAQCLVQCLERRAAATDYVLAPAMASRNSPLMQRAERLLEGVEMNTKTAHLPIGIASLLVLAGAILLLPAITPHAAQLAVPATTLRTDSKVAVATATATASPRRIAAASSEATSDESHTQISVDDNDDDPNSSSMKIKLRNGSRSLDAAAKGKMVFNVDESDLESLSKGGTASIQETVGGVTRRIEFRTADAGLQRRFFLDGKEHEFDTEARQWLAGVIPDMLRESGINIEARVERLFKQGGADAVLADIAQIRSDYARGVAMRHLLAKHVLSGEQLDRALVLIGSIRSDYELRGALAVVFDSQQIDAARMAKLLQIANQLGSDYERAEFLLATAERASAESNLRALWLKAAMEIDADYERSRCLQRLIELNTNPDQLSDILVATAGIDSDYEKRSVLMAIAQRLSEPNAIAVRYAQAVQSIKSDYERREALTALLRAGQIGSDAALAVLDVAAGINSDYERREVLVTLAHSMPEDPAVRARYLQIAAKMSDYEREQAERAIGAVRG